MVIIKQKTLHGYSLQYPEAKLAIHEWATKTETSDWSNFMEIKTEESYKEAFAKIDALIAENFENSEIKQKEFLGIAKAIQAYEKEYYPLPKPETVTEMV